MSKTRIRSVTEQEFKLLLFANLIRPASLEDVYGKRHKRTLYRHPNTGQYFVEESHSLARQLEKELSIALFNEVNRINSEH